MAETTLGTASIDVSLDLSKLEKDLNKLKKQIKSALSSADSKGLEAFAKRVGGAFRQIERDAGKASKAIARIKPPKSVDLSKLKTRIAKSTASMKLRLNTTQFREDLLKAKERVGKTSASMTLKLSRTAFNEQLKTLKEQVGKRKLKISLTLSRTAFNEQLRAIKERVGKTSITIKLKMTSADFRESFAKLRERTSKARLAVNLKINKGDFGKELAAFVQKYSKKSIKITLQLDTRKIDSQIEALKRKLERSFSSSKVKASNFAGLEREGTQAFRNISREARTTGDNIARLRIPIGQVAAAIGALGLGRLVGEALRLSSEFEKTEIAFETMLGSAEAATAMLTDLENFASATPFNFSDITKASQQLTAYGFAAENVIPSLNGIGNAVAAVGGGADEFNRLTYALGQIRSRGKLVQDEFKQLVQLGLPVGEILSEKLGLTTAELSSLGEAGISAGDALGAIFEGFDERFGGLMQRQSETVSGLFSNLQDEAEFALRAVGEYFTEAFNLKGVLKGLIRVTQAIRQAFDERSLRPLGIFGIRLEALKTVALGLALAALPKLAVAIKAVGQAMTGAIRRFLPFLIVAAAITTAIKLIQINAYGLGDAWGKVSAFIQERIGSLKNVYYAFLLNSETVGSSVSRIIAALGVIFGEFGGVVAVVMRETIKTFVSFVQAVATAVSGLSRILLGAGQLFVAYIADPLRGVANFVVDALNFIGRNFARLVRGLGRILAPLGGVFQDWASAGVQALGERLGNSVHNLVEESALAARGLQNIRDGAASLQDAGGQFGDYFNAVGDAAQNINQAFTDFKGDAVIEAFSEIKAASSQAATAVLETWKGLEAGEITFTPQVSAAEASSAADYGLPDFSNVTSTVDDASDAMGRAGRAARGLAADSRGVDDVLKELADSQQFVADKLRNGVIEESDAATANMQLLERAIDEVIEIDADNGAIAQLLSQLEQLKAASPEAARELRELKEQLTSDTISRLRLQVDYTGLDPTALRSSLEQLRSSLEQELRQAVALDNLLDAESLQKQVDDIDSALGDSFERVRENIRDSLSDLEIKLELGDINLDDYIAQLEQDVARLREQTDAAFDANDDELGRALFDAMQDANSDLEGALSQREDILKKQEEASRDESLERYTEAMAEAANQYALNKDQLERLNSELAAQQKRTLDLIASKGIENDATQQALLLTEQTIQKIKQLEREQKAAAIAQDFALFGDEVKRLNGQIDLQRETVKQLANEYGEASQQVQDAQAELERFNVQLEATQRANRIAEVERDFAAFGDESKRLSGLIDIQSATIKELGERYGDTSQQVIDAVTELRGMEAQLAAVERASKLEQVNQNFAAFGDEVKRLNGVIGVQNEEINDLIKRYTAASPVVASAVAELRRLEVQLAAVSRQQTLAKANDLAQLNYQLTGNEAKLVSDQLKAQQAFIDDLAKTYEGRLVPELMDAQAELEALQSRLAAVQYNDALEDAQRSFSLLGDESKYLSALISIQQKEVSRLGDAYRDGAQPLEAAKALLEGYQAQLRDLKRESANDERIARAFDDFERTGDRVALLSARIQSQTQYLSDLQQEFGRTSAEAQNAQRVLDAMNASLADYNYLQERASNFREFNLFGDKDKFYSDQIKVAQDELRRLTGLEGDHSAAIERVRRTLKNLEARQRSYTNSANLENIINQYRATGDEVARLNALIQEQERVTLEKVTNGASDSAIDAERAKAQELRLELIQLQQTRADTAAALDFERTGDRGGQLSAELEARKATVQALSAEYRENTEIVQQAQTALEQAEQALAVYEAKQSQPLTVLRAQLDDAIKAANTGYDASQNRLEQINALIAAQRDYVLGVAQATGTQSEAYDDATARLERLTKLQDNVIARGTTAIASSFDAEGFIELQDAMLQQAEAARIMRGDVEGYIEAIAEAINALDGEIGKVAVGSEAYNALSTKLEELKTQYRELVTDPMAKAAAAMKVQEAIAKGLGQSYDVLSVAIQETEKALEDYIRDVYADEKISEREQANIERTRRTLVQLRNERDRNRDTLDKMATAFAGAASVMEGSSKEILEGISAVATGLKSLKEAAEGDSAAVVASIATIADGIAQIAGDAPESFGNSMVEGFFAASGTIAELATGIPLLGKLGATVGNIVSSVFGDLANGSQQVREQLAEMAQQSGGLLSESLLKAISVTKRVNRGGLAGLFGGTKEALDEEATKIGVTLANGIIGTLEQALGAANFEAFAKAFDVGIDKIIQKQLIQGFLVSGAVQERIGSIVKLIRDGGSSEQIAAERQKLKDDTAAFYQQLRGALPDLYSDGATTSNRNEIKQRDTQTLQLSPSASLAASAPIIDGARKMQVAAGQFMEAVKMFRDVIGGGINIPVNINNAPQQAAGDGSSNLWRALQNA